MKEFLLSLFFCIIVIGRGFSQITNNNLLQPTYIVGRQINATGEVVKTLESEFSYDEYGKVKHFQFPDYSLSCSFVYVDNYLRQEGITHVGGYIEYLEFLIYTYNADGRIKHISHEWSDMNADEHWDYSYDDYGRLKQKDYREGNFVYHQHYMYDYENDDKTIIESYWTSWETEGMKLKKKTVRQYDDDFKLVTVYTEHYNLEGDTTNMTLLSYTYTPFGKEETQVFQNYMEGEWTNISIQNYFYDEYDRVIEQQNGTWSTENNDWNNSRKITFLYEPQEENIVCTVSFYKKSGEEWVWDTFNNETVLFGSHLKNQQRTLRYYVYEDLHGSGNINQFEFTYSYTMEPIYLGVNEDDRIVYTLHPNPTTGQVTITGKNLKCAEVFNTLGQSVATAQGEGERLMVDIGALPAGIYFVNVTDGNGRKCVRKVVKE